VGVVTGLLLGAGLCLVLWAVTSPPPPRRVRSRWSADLADLLVQAGAPGVSAAGLIAAMVLGVTSLQQDQRSRECEHHPSGEDC